MYRQSYKVMYLVYGITSDNSPIELPDAMRITGLSREELESLDYIEIVEVDTIDEYLMNLYNETSI